MPFQTLQEPTVPNGSSILQTSASSRQLFGLAEALLKDFKEGKLKSDKLYEILSANPSLAVDIFQAGLLSVYTHLYERALSSKTASWTELFLKRFDPEFRSKDLAEGAKTQINVFGNWTDDELRAFVRAQSRKVLGEAV